MKNDDRNEDEQDDFDYEPHTYVEKTSASSGAQTPQKGANSGAHAPQTTNKNRPVQGGGRRPPRKPPQSQFAVFYIVSLLVAVVVCIVVFAIVFSGSVNDTSDNNPSANNPTQTPLFTTKPVPANLAEFVGVIRSIDGEEESIVCMDISDGSEYALNAESTTEMHDEYGEEIVFAEFSVGDIVNVSVDPENNALTTLNMEPKAFEKKQVEGFVLDETAHTISVGNDVYTYDDKVMVHYQDKPVGISTVEPIDVINIRGYEDQVYSIEVNKSHGELAITNYEKIENGTVEVNPYIYMPLGDFKPTAVVEGQHTINVKGTNIETYSKEVVIVPNETFTLDLNDVQYKSGTINLKVNAPDAVVKVDDQVVEGEAIILPYGTHTLTVEAEGYAPSTQTLDVKEPSIDVDVVLKEKIAVCSLTVGTTPQGADVYIDNGYAGTSPVTRLVPYGEHTIRVQKDGYIETESTISLGVEERSVKVTLHPVEVETPAPQTEQPTTVEPTEAVPGTDQEGVYTFPPVETAQQEPQLPEATEEPVTIPE